MRYAPGYVALERALSKLGLASRIEARALVDEGAVMVNGRLAAHPLMAVHPERDRIQVRGTRAARGEWRTIAFHKPRGVVTTRRDPEGRPTVFGLLGDAGAGLIAVGRLDLASSGLLLLTNDTQLGERLTDPASGIVRRYVVTVRGRVTDDEVACLQRGIGNLRPEGVEVRKRSARETHVIVALKEGKNREIRRLFAAIDHEVTRLLRVAFGPIELGTLQPGVWRAVAREELAWLGKPGGPV